MPKTVSFVTPEDQENLLDRIAVLETAEQQRQERHERKIEPQEKVELAYEFKASPWYAYVEEKLLQFKEDGHYNAKDEEVHIFDELCEKFDKSTAFAFRNAYSPIRAVVTRLLMADHPWARPPVSKNDRRVTVIKSCNADPYLWKHDPINFAWLREWHERKAMSLAKRNMAKKDASSD